MLRKQYKNTPFFNIQEMLRRKFTKLKIQLFRRTLPLNIMKCLKENFKNLQIWTFKNSEELYLTINQEILRRRT